MKKLFWRLTMMFWILFCIVILSFGLTFYLNYEQNYSRKLLEINRNVNDVGYSLESNLNEYRRLLQIQNLNLKTILEQKITLFNSLSSAELNRLAEQLQVNDKQMSKEEKIGYLAYVDTVHIVNNTLNQKKDLYQEESEIIEFKFISFNLEKEAELMKRDLENIHLVKMQDGTYIVNDVDFNEDYPWSIYQAVEYGDKVIGYLQIILKSLTDEDLSSGGMIFDESLYYIGNDLYGLSHLPTSIQRQLDSVTFEEVTTILKDEGYYITRYFSNDNTIKIIHYESKHDLFWTILKQSLSLFELSTALLIMLLLLVSYLLFIGIVRPGYLLIEYVKSCGEGNYAIPAHLSETWRDSFIMVRSAYLENERLLNIKENQSQELEYAWKRALVANQAKTHFLAKVSHEFKTPLNAINGYVQLLKLTIEQPKQRKQLDIIQHSSDLLLKQVNELLEFSVLEEGKIKLSINKIDIFETAHKVEELFVIETANKGIGFYFNIDKRIPHRLFGDEDRIKQIMINLISNAIKFTEKGEIKVILDLDFENETDVYLNIKVQDTGKGIAPNKLEAIFESFTQEDDTISRTFGGTGLGLSISQRLAEVMGGRLTVESELGVGSTFTLFLPLSKHLIGQDEA
ncbi:MAG: two-component sensor histidine kinase [Turicibacter sp.]|nr:two-component sensor histidine kinase [Turicibacter sp.]